MSKTSQLIFLKDLENLDYNEVGLKSGLEIHQQLNCGKLFSKAPCKIVPNEELDKEVFRKLRFTKSEDGNVDKAALHEFRQQNTYKYLYNNEIATLVDLDEEPPTHPNTKALHTVLQVGQMLELDFFNTITFMRKLIVDGSITSGFQRTAMIGTNGKIKTKVGDIDIYGINLEEDSCRIISKEGKEHIFALDRQGIPLIEITTGPNMKTPQEVQEVAKEIGNILRSFSATRRGIGTIRQDLNVSVKCGKRVEIKGAQNFELIPEVVIAEAKRQIILNSIKLECETRNITQKTLSDYKIQTITKIFNKTESKVILSELEKKDAQVLAIKLYNFKNILGHEIQENYRFATEISNRNKKLFPTIKGLFHSDELPKYNISQEEVDAIYKELSLDQSKDSFIIIANNKTIATESLEYILELIPELIEGPHEEVRQVDPKGTTTIFLRPMPGSARMYPETDIFTIPLSSLPMKKLKESLPEKYNDKLNRLEKEYSYSKSQVETLFGKINEEQLVILLKTSELNAKELYNILIDVPKDIKKRNNVEPIDLQYELLEDLLSFSNKNKLNQQTIRDILISLYQNNINSAISIKEHVETHNLIQEQLSEEDLRKKIKEIIEKNKDAPFGALMGMCMKEFAKKAEGKIISKVLKEEMN